MSRPRIDVDDQRPPLLVDLGWGRGGRGTPRPLHTTFYSESTRHRMLSYIRPSVMLRCVDKRFRNLMSFREHDTAHIGLLHPPWASSLVDIAPYPHLIEWARENTAWDDYDSVALVMACANVGSVATLGPALDIALHLSWTRLLVEQVCHRAARKGHVNVLQWALANGHMPSPEAVAHMQDDLGVIWVPVQFAVLEGHVHILEWMYDTYGPRIFSPHVNEYATSHASDLILEWLRNHNSM
jgi:Ankyrin repeats (many copies)